MDDNGLSRDDIFAMRKADSVTFHTHDGRSYVRTYLRSYGQPRIWSVREQEAFNEIPDYAHGDERQRTIPVSVARLESYGPTRYDRDGYSAFASYVPREVWTTITDTMRPGDRIAFHWIANNDSPNLNAVGYHHDELRISLHGPDGKRNRHYSIAHSVCPDNSARMVTRNHRLTGVPLSE